MTAAPLWLIENVRLPDREGLWQIAIDKGRFGDITPMGEARKENFEVLNARGGLVPSPLLLSRISTLIRPKPPESRTGTSPGRCLKGLSVGRSVRLY